MAKDTCSVVEDGTRCPRQARARGWCSMHWARWKKSGDPLIVHSRAWRGTPEERFWRKVDKNGPIPEHFPELGPCWVWTAATTPHGYGQFWNGERLVVAHRWLWTQRIGEPDALLCHRCDNPPCVNLAHLFEGSQTDNMRDMARKGRTSQQRQTHCIRGHEFTPSNIYWDALGHRVCRACWHHNYLVYRKAKGKR